MANSQIQTFEVGKGRQFVAGLFWQPLPGATASARKAEIEKIAEEQRFDLAVIRTTGAPQVGFGSTSDGLKQGMLSAAAVISKTVELEHSVRNFLCATEVPGGRWLYVAQREGVLLHDGDILGAEDEIRSRLLTDQSLSDWETIFAPGHWAVTGAIEKPFVEFLPKKGGKLDYKKWWGLRPVRRSWREIAKNYWYLIAIVVLGLGGAYGYSRWQQYVAEQEMARLVADQAAQAAATANAPVKLEHPWKKAPRATRFAAECVATIGKVKTLWPGNWNLKDITCANGVMTVGWQRQETGWIQHLLAVEPKAVISKDGSAATLTVPMVALDGEDEAVPTENERMLAIFGGAQQFGFKVNMSSPPAPVALPGDKPNGQQPVKDWRELAWSVVGVSLAPEITVPAMDGNGFRINRIQAVWSAGVMNWNMEGVQYVQP